MVIDPDIEERRFRFEARRLAVDTYIKVHVERAAGARLLVASYFRLIFTLSLGTLAAAVTLASAWARFGATGPIGHNQTIVLLFSVLAVAALILSAILAANGMRRAAGWSIRSVRDPLPESGSAIEKALGNNDVGENEIFGHIMVSMNEMSNSSEIERPGFMPPLLAYLVAVLCALVSILCLSV
jgi:hypothetical protein